MCKEIWVYIKGYKGLYEVSNLGRVRSLSNDRSRKEKILKPVTNVKGYLYVGLCKDGKQKMHYIHRLVAEAFLPNLLGYTQINHKIEGPEGKRLNRVIFTNDGDIDPRRTTIEWVSCKENINYGTRNERMARTQSKPVLQYTLDGEFVKEWLSAKECGRNGFKSVSACCRGKRKSCGGYLWKYRDEND